MADELSMQRPLIRIAAVALSGSLLAILIRPAFVHPPFEWLRILALLVFACAALSPRTSLLLLAALVPLAAVISGFAHSPLRLLDLLIVASCAGWSVRCSVRPDTAKGVPDEILRPILLLAAIAVTSGVVQLVGLRGLIGPQRFMEEFGRAMLHNFFSDRGHLHLVGGVVLLLESLAVLCAAAASCAASPSFRATLVRMLIAGATGAAALNLARVLEIALRTPSPMTSIWESVRSLRINTAYGDVNAAGSFFAMSAVLALATVHEARGRWKILPSAAVAILMAAAWLTGSRAAVAAILLACAGLLAIRFRRGTALPAMAWGFGLCAAGAVAFATVFANPVTGTAATVALFVRQEMARISFRIFAAEPWFGVGIGRFYAASGAFIESSPLAAYYRNENAHNTVLQWIAETGVAGAIAAAWLLLVLLRMARRYTRTGEGAPLFEYVTAALLVFAATALLGHPLLTPEVSLSAGLVLGVFVGTVSTRAAVSSAVPHARPALLIAAIVTLVVWTPWRVRQETARAPLEHVAWGVSGWQTDAAGRPFRRMTGPATLFIPTRSGWAEVPYRLSDGAAPAVLLLTFRGRPADRLVVADHEWHRYMLRIAASRDTPLYEPLEIRVVEGSSSEVLLGKVLPRGTSD